MSNDTASGTQGGNGGYAIVIASFLPTANVPLAVTVGYYTVGTTTASVQAGANPRGASTTLSVQYGLDQTYGNTTSGVVVGSGNQQVNQIFALTGLTPGTTYHYRAVATSSVGTAYGADFRITTFGTGVSTPSVTTLPATHIGAGSMTFNASIGANGTDTVVYFAYGSQLTLGQVTAAIDIGTPTLTTISINASSVSSGRVYYQAVATNSAGATFGGIEFSSMTRTIVSDGLVTALSPWT